MVEADRPVLEHYRVAMEGELRTVGVEPHFTRAMLAYALDDVVAVAFAPEDAFDQTPGSRAGARIGTQPSGSAP